MRLESVGGMKEALLLSGGQDSAALLYLIRPSVAITIDYGQRPAEGEIQASQQLCATISVEHRLVRADCSALGSGDLAGKAALGNAPVSEWWPYRNQLLATLAGAIALEEGCNRLALGTVKTDDIHRDGTLQFYAALSSLMSLQEGGLEVCAPAIGLTTAELVRQSGIPMDQLFWAHSCHVSNVACGVCRGCIKHRNVTYELGIDPF